MKDNRVTLYIRPKKDRDIREYIVDNEDKANPEDLDQSQFFRDLLRDGIKYRQLGNPVPIEAKTVKPLSPPNIPVESVTSTTFPDFSGIELHKKELDEQTLNKRLGSL